MQVYKQQWQFSGVCRHQQIWGGSIRMYACAGGSCLLGVCVCRVEQWGASMHTNKAVGWDCWQVHTSKVVGWGWSWGRLQVIGCMSTGNHRWNPWWSGSVSQWKSYGSDYQDVPWLGIWGCAANGCSHAGTIGEVNRQRSAQIKMAPFHGHDHPALLNLDSQAKPKPPRGTRWTLGFEPLCPCSLLAILKPNFLGSMQAGVLSLLHLQTAFSVSSNIHAEIMASPVAKIPGVYGVSGPLLNYLTNPFLRSCWRPGVNPGVPQPCAGFPASFCVSSWSVFFLFTFNALFQKTWSECASILDGQFFCGRCSYRLHLDGDLGSYPYLVIFHLLPFNG